MRFIHAADIHLDSPLTGLSAYPDAPVELLRTATRDAFSRLVDEAIAEKVDFMIIAGDLYDGNWKDFNTGLYFVRQMGRLRAASIPVYLLFGNHDAENDMTRRLTMPDNVHCFRSTRAETFLLPSLQVAIHGRSFKEAATVENLAIGYPQPVAGWLNIGVLHTALEGGSTHANYAPCTIAELHARGYEYWALGHVHEHQVWRGESTIAFPGNLQGRHIRETGPRGALMVSASEQTITSVDRLHVDVLRWHALQVDVSSASDLATAASLVGRALEELHKQNQGSVPMAVRVTLTGASPAHGELFGAGAQLRAEVLASAAGIGAEHLWIEKVKLSTTPPEQPADVASRADAVADLQSLLDAADADPEFVRGLKEDLMAVLNKVPVELVGGSVQLQAIKDGQVDELIRSTARSLVAHLSKAR